MADLYIQNSSCSLSVREQRVLVRNEEQILLKEISFNLIDNILVFGNAQLSTQLLKALANRDIFVFYFSARASFYFPLIPIGRKILKSSAVRLGLLLTRTFAWALLGKSLRPRLEISSICSRLLMKMTCWTRRISNALVMGWHISSKREASHRLWESKGDWLNLTSTS